MAERIIVAGAGLGGLSLAYELGEKGYEITVIEAARKGELSYLWADEMEQDIFKELRLPLPEGTETSPGWAFVPPFSKEMLYAESEEGEGNYEIHRRKFSTLMAERASKAEFLYETKVTGPIVENGFAVGVNTDKGEFRGDIVVDCLGVNSVLRKNLPDEFDIEKTTEHVFQVYKAKYKRADVPAEKPINKVYIKHLGNPGISWCLDRDTYVDILVGRLGGGLTQEFIDRAVKDLTETNKCLDKSLSGEGSIYDIPVRYPLSKLVHNGYVLMGDSAYMTVPVMGSGMATSIRAGKILADVISKKSAPYRTEDLWEYQVKVFEVFGALHAGVDVVKRGLLKFSDNDVVNVFVRGILTKDDIKKATSGKPITLSNKGKLDKIKSGIKYMPTLLKLNKTVINMEKASKIAGAIPRSYSEKAVADWRKKLDGFFEKISQ